MAAGGLVMLGPWRGTPSSPTGSGAPLAEHGDLLVPSLLAADVVAALAARLDEAASGQLEWLKATGD